MARKKVVKKVDRKKASLTKKKSSLVAKIFTYATPANRSWVEQQAKKYGCSMSAFTNDVITEARLDARNGKKLARM